MKLRILILLLITINIVSIQVQNIAASPEYIIALTSDWQGERFPDGRPKVSDNLLERLKKLTLEEVWDELIVLDYQNQYEGVRYAKSSIILK